MAQGDFDTGERRRRSDLTSAHDDVLIKRRHLTIAVISLGFLLLSNWTYLAYTAGQTTERLSTIVDKLQKIDNVPARIQVLESADREHERRLGALEERIK